MSLLALTDLRVSYGGINAVKGLTLSVEAGELVCLIGANGAGKTTTLKAITSLVHAASGTITYDGTSLLGRPAYEIAAMGICLVPEGRGLFPRLTIEENLFMGAYLRRDKYGIVEDMERMFTLFPRLKERRRQTSGTLSGGEQQLLALGRALMSRPTLLLLDEPSMGLSPLMVQTVFDVIRTVSDSGVTILLVEQNARLALTISQRGYVMDNGLITMADQSSDLLANPKVREAYLGECH